MAHVSARPATFVSARYRTSIAVVRTPQNQTSHCRCTCVTARHCMLTSHANTRQCMTRDSACTSNSEEKREKEGVGNTCWSSALRVDTFFSISLEAMAALLASGTTKPVH
eukprot:1037497-Rhodomonas_salina.2